MFENHQPVIAGAAQSRADNLARVLQFVILSIRQPIRNMPADMETAIANGPDSANVLWGWKRAAFDAAWFHRYDHHWNLCDMLDHSDNEDELADCFVSYMALHPGFGPVKAGFVAQLALGVSGCLDQNNVKRFDLPPRKFDAHRFKALSATGRRKRVGEYNATVRRLGGTAALWNSWCDYVASRDGIDTAHDVSRVHVDALAPYIN
jgi:hypothetical protein